MTFPHNEVKQSSQKWFAEMKKLTDRQIDIANNILGDSAKYIISSLEEGRLSHDETEMVCDKISGEFHLNGIDENFEATSYGVELEELLDIINRPRLA